MISTTADALWGQNILSKYLGEKYTSDIYAIIQLMLLENKKIGKP